MGAQKVKLATMFQLGGALTHTISQIIVALHSFLHQPNEQIPQYAS
jgi:hypothetical protein